MAQTLETILAAETKLFNDNVDRRAELLALPTLTDDQKGELETLNFLIAHVHEQGLPEVARCEYLSQRDHDEYVDALPSHALDREIERIEKAYRVVGSQLLDRKILDEVARLVRELAEARAGRTVMHRRAQVAEAALGSKRELHAVMMQNHGLRWQNELLKREIRWQRRKKL